MSAASRTLNLSPLDLIPPKYYTQLVLSFETTEAVECILPRLQISLDKTCHSIPWLGGKLVPTTEKEARRARAASELGQECITNDRNCGSLSESCMAVAAAGMPLSTIPGDKWPRPNRIDNRLHNTGTSVFAGGLPSFSVSDGVILRICIHHNVVDAGSMAEVFRVWTSI
jgi:hypothetical protein